MSFYTCMIRNCTYRDKITTNRKFIFGHYLKHLRQELNEVAKDLNISSPYFENRYSLINSIINNSKDDQ
jgi:hypothetical protein